jgi:hypothetical protein
LWLKTSQTKAFKDKLKTKQSPASYTKNANFLHILRGLLTEQRPATQQKKMAM